MNTEYNIDRFERELGKVQRPGMDKLLEYIQKSDFYTAPASTKYHLAAPRRLAAAQPQRLGRSAGTAGLQLRHWDLGVSRRLQNRGHHPG